jgi:hypothetical protein
MKLKQGYAGAKGGAWPNLPLAAVCSQKFYKCCIFSAICKVNVEINCINIQHKKVNYRQLWRIILE